MSPNPRKTASSKAPRLGLGWVRDTCWCGHSRTSNWGENSSFPAEAGECGKSVKSLSQSAQLSSRRFRLVAGSISRHSQIDEANNVEYLFEEKTDSEEEKDGDDYYDFDNSRWVQTCRIFWCGESAVFTVSQYHHLTNSKYT